MKVGVFGSGMVGQAIGGKAAELGHEVMVGTRNPAKLQEWLGKVGAAPELAHWPRRRPTARFCSMPPTAAALSKRSPWREKPI